MFKYLDENLGLNVSNNLKSNKFKVEKLKDNSNAQLPSKYVLLSKVYATEGTKLDGYVSYEFIFMTDDKLGRLSVPRNGVGSSLGYEIVEKVTGKTKADIEKS